MRALLIAGYLVATSQSFTVSPIPVGGTRRRVQTNLRITQTNTTSDVFSPIGLASSSRFDTDAWEQKQTLDAFREISTTLPSLSRNDDVWKARGLLLTAAALYGTNFATVKLLGNTMPVGISTTFRFGLASIVTLPWLLAPNSNDAASLQQQGTKQDDTRLPAILCGMEIGLYNAIAYLAQAVGLETTDASKSAFICSMAVVIVPILDYLTGKKLTRDQLVGAIMAVAGVAFLELGGAQDLSFSAGEVATCIQPIGFGLGFWRMEEAMRKYPHEAKRATAAQILPVLALSALYCAFTESIDTSQVISWLVDPPVLFSLFWTGAITTALTVYMESLAMKTLSAAETTLIFSTEPIWGAAFASVVMGEHLGSGAAIGAALVVAGCLFSNIGWQGLQQTKTWTGFIGSLLASLQIGSHVSMARSTVEESTEIMEDLVEEVIKSTSDSL